MTATISSHILDAVTGTHVAAVTVTLACLKSDGTHEVIFSTATDAGGRISKQIDLAHSDMQARYEMIFATGPHWRKQDDGGQIMQEIVLRFLMPDHHGSYHMPIIISPHGYSLWWSRVEV